MVAHPRRCILFVLAAYSILGSFGVLSLTGSLGTLLAPGTVLKYDSAMPGQNGLVAIATKMGMSVEAYPAVAGAGPLNPTRGNHPVRRRGPR